MALKIRLRQQGRTNRHMYRLVVMDSRQARDGKYIEALGWYNPIAPTDEALLEIKAERVDHWVSMGAEVSERAAALLARRAPEILQRQSAKGLEQRAKRTAQRRRQRQKQRAV